jgi:hypothetical protein
MRLLFFGDLFGKIGRKVLEKKLPELKKKYQADTVIINAENTTHGKFLSLKHLNFLLDLGVDAITLGDHTFSGDDYEEVLSHSLVLRPANYPKKLTGKGSLLLDNGFLIINLAGQVFMREIFSSPFEKIDEILENYKDKKIKGVILDFHAEATSEKYAMFRYLDKRVSAILGTHTHVQTNDLQISKEKTVYVSDVGMNGPKDSILGMETDLVLEKFLTSRNKKFHPAENGGGILNAVFINFNNKGEALEAELINETFI